METTLQDAPATRASEDERRDALAGRLFGARRRRSTSSPSTSATSSGCTPPCVELGEATPGQLAAASGCDARYVREWLEHQAITAIVEVATASDDDEARTYRLPAGHAEALLDQYVPRLHRAARARGGRRRPGDAAARGGVPQRRRHRVRRLRPRPHARAGRAQPPAVRGAPGHRVHPGAAGRRRAPARAAAGTRPRRRLRHRAGRASPSPGGYARRHRRRARRRRRLDRRGTRERRRGGPRGSGAPGARRLHAPPAGPYALVTILEALHDLPHPVETLAAARGALEPGGCRARDGRARRGRLRRHRAPVERFMYGVSVIHCLPVGRAQDGRRGHRHRHAHPDAARATPSRPGSRRSTCSSSTTPCTASTA